MNAVLESVTRTRWQQWCALLLLTACSKTAQPPTPANAESSTPESSTQVTTQAVSLTAADNGRTVDMSANQEFSITLQTIGGGSYGAPEISSAAVQPLPEGAPGVQNPGGPRQVLRFRAVSAGEAEITVPHSEQPQPFRVKISVR